MQIKEKCGSVHSQSSSPSSLMASLVEHSELSELSVSLLLVVPSLCSAVFTGGGAVAVMPRDGGGFSRSAWVSCIDKGAGAEVAVIRLTKGGTGLVLSERGGAVRVWPTAGGERATAGIFPGSRRVMDDAESNQS